MGIKKSSIAMHMKVIFQAQSMSEQLVSGLERRYTFSRLVTNEMTRWR